MTNKCNILSAMIYIVLIFAGETEKKHEIITDHLKQYRIHKGNIMFTNV